MAAQRRVESRGRGRPDYLVMYTLRNRPHMAVRVDSNSMLDGSRWARRAVAMEWSGREAADVRVILLLRLPECG
jgi:hypothetical protein